MKKDLPTYNRYKDSNQPWLGKIPEHWEVLPNRALFKEVDERNQPEELMLSVTIDQGVIQQKELLADSSKKDSSRLDKSGYKLVYPGDIAYNKMRAWQGAIGVSDYKGIVSPAYIVQRLRSADDHRYYHYLFRTPLFKKEAERWSYGITSDMWSLRPEHFRIIYSPHPPQSEQHAITYYLDWADERIQRLINAREKEIELLEEYKQVIIQQAVTGQIDVRTGETYPEYKDYGMKWLGHIPEKWNTKRLKFIINISSGQIDPSLPDQKSKILIAPNHIEIGSGRIVKFESAADQDASSGKYEVRKGQIIYSKIRPNLRKVTIAPFACLCSADMYPISVKKEIRTEYMLLLLLSKPFTQYAVDCSLRVKMPKVNREELGEALLWFPNTDRQVEILRFVEDISEPIDKAINVTRQAIKLLNEYRTRLIADVVTGKVDVRQAAANLPEHEDQFDNQLLDCVKNDIEGETYANQ